MYQICEENNWGDPFSYARSREIHLAGLLGHRVADDYSGADAYDNNNNPVEYKSTIGKKLTATYNGISVQNTWEDQVKYLKEDKIGKYKHHYYARYKSGKVIEVYRLHADVVLSILLPKLSKYGVSDLPNSFNLLKYEAGQEFKKHKDVGAHTHTNKRYKT